MFGMSGERIEKTERLLNLTLALLASRRPMRKNEIFSTIPGYSGTAESMERMFERDKDELRELGISVQVLPVDPYFEDDIGYQIISKEYFLPDIRLTREESIWLAIATAVLSESTTSMNVNGALQKLLSGNEIPVNEILQNYQSWNLKLPLNESLLFIWQSLKEKSPLQFNYNTGVKSSLRILSPYSVTSRNGHWFLVGSDHDDSRVKTFRVDRMVEIASALGTQFLELEDDFDLERFLASFGGERIPKLVIRLHREISRMHPLVAKSSHARSDEPLKIGTELLLHDIDRLEAFDLVLWAGEAVEVIEPQEMRSEVISILERIIGGHS